MSFALTVFRTNFIKPRCKIRAVIGKKLENFSTHYYVIGVLVIRKKKNGHFGIRAYVLWIEKLLYDRQKWPNVTSVPGTISHVQSHIFSTRFNWFLSQSFTTCVWYAVDFTIFRQRKSPEVRHIFCTLDTTD